MFIREILPVAGANDLGTRIMAEKEGGKTYGSGMRLQGPGWHINNKAFNPAIAAGLKLACDQFVMPVMKELRLLNQPSEPKVHESVKIMKGRGLVFVKNDRHWFASFAISSPKAKRLR